MGTSRKKSTRRNTGGRRNPTPPPYSGGPSFPELERGMEVMQIAKQVAAHLSSRWH